MSVELSGGTDQPGIRRSGRRGQRQALRSLETDLGTHRVVDLEGNARGEMNRVMAERYQSFPPVNEVQGCRCLCVWPKDRISINRIWHAVRHELHPHGERVGKIAQINQPGGILRYDVYVEAEHLTWVYRRLKRQAPILRWMIKHHQHFWERRLQRERVPTTLMNSSESRFQISAKMGTWNIHSIAEKRNELGMYLHKNGIDILALQETWRNSDQWPLRLKGFNVFESVAEKGMHGRNGVAVCVRNNLVAYEIGQMNPYMVTVRILLGTVEWNIMSVYIPPNGGNTALRHSRRDALMQVKQSIQHLIDKDLGVKIAIIGDWNMKPDILEKKIRRWRLPLCLKPCQGSPMTFMGRNTWSSIDHMVMTHEAALYAGKCRVNRTWDLSDHWPVDNVIRGEIAGDADDNLDGGVVEANVGLRIDVKKLASTGFPIADDNRWSALALDEEDDDDNIEQMADDLENIVREICNEAEVVHVTVESTCPLYRLSREAKIAIGRRRAAYKWWMMQVAPVKTGAQWDRYLAYKAIALKAKRKASQNSWLRHVVNGASALASHDMHGFWRWVKSTTHKGKSGPSDLGPLQSPDNPQLLVYQPREKLIAWRLHYENLLADVSGHSRDEQYWAEKFQGPPLHPIQGLNGIIKWWELNNALHTLKGHKAPGRDGIPSEFYKLAIEDASKAEFNGEVPKTVMGKALLNIVNRLYRESIPNKWNEAWVVSILKGGDPTDMNNYRGISLIVVIVKITTLIVSTRLASKLEESKFFIKEQAGFRWREECAGHVCALYEILRRRQIQRKLTFVAFIDIRKAYDTVPIEGLMRKLYMIGVSGTTLAYFRSLYMGATVRVRTKYGVSDVVNLMRGLRQGCNASPLLFDIFINDILSECAAFGVHVIGLDKDGRIVGLLYADDLVLICSKRSDLRRALEKIQSWGILHEMTFGVKKCGIMGFGNGAVDRLRLRQWRLDDQVIPIVETYDYLGIPFTSDLNLSIISEARAVKGLKVLNSVRPLIGCIQIPLTVRINVVKALIVPVLTYGGELWGMNSERSVKPQKVLSEALRIMARLRVRSSMTSSATLGLEFGIPPISAIVAGARVRAMKKFPQLQTIIADLMRSPPRCSLHTWLTGTIWWVKRFCGEAATELDPRIASEMVKACVWNRFNVASKSKTCKFYLDNGLVKTCKYLAFATHNPIITRGIYWLCRLRVGAVWYANRLAAIGYIDQQFRNQCPFCNMVGKETPEHLLLVCNRWRQYREEYLGEYIAFHNPTWVQLLGGSNLNGGGEGDERNVNFTRLWCPQNPGHIDVDLQLPQHGNEIEGNLPVCVLVAQYLQKVMPIRFGLLRSLMEDPRADADQGMAVLVNQPELLLDGEEVDADVAEIDPSDNDEGDTDNRGGMVANFL